MKERVTGLRRIGLIPLTTVDHTPFRAIIVHPFRHVTITIETARAVLSIIHHWVKDSCNQGCFFDISCAFLSSVFDSVLGTNFQSIFVMG